jgi:hypothetical protein
VKKIVGIIVSFLLTLSFLSFFAKPAHADTVELTPDRFYSINRSGNNTATPDVIGRWDDNGTWAKWLSHWDFSSIPAGSTITGATLWANQTNWAQGGSYAYVFRVKPANENWTTSATWTTKDGTTPWAGSDGLGTADTDYDSVSLGSVYTPSGDYFITLDPQLFQSVVDNNESLLFTALDNYNAWNTGPLTSNPSSYLKLVLTYTLPAATPTPTPTPSPTPTPTPIPGADYAVRYNTSGYLETTTTASVGASFSIEFLWQNPWPQNSDPPYNVIGPNSWLSETGGVGLFQLVNSPIDPQNNVPTLYGGIDATGRMFLYDETTNHYTYSTLYTWEQDQIYRLYYARDATGRVYFGQNGSVQSIQRSPDAGGAGYLYLGSGYTGKSQGVMDEFRLSSTVRYTTNYTPSLYFTSDEQALILAHMNEGTGPTTADVSGNGYIFDFKEDTDWVLSPVSSTPLLTELLPAKVLVGLKNSDAVGIKFDLLAEVYKDGTLVSSGQIDSVPGGSSGFNNAKLNIIPFASFDPVPAPEGTELSLKLYVRNACVGSGQNSGVARLWYNDNIANSQFGATIGNNTNTYYLVDGFNLWTTPGIGPKLKIDVAAGAKCSPFKLFASWSTTL